jgi:autophagy-related protein 11
MGCAASRGRPVPSPSKSYFTSLPEGRISQPAVSGLIDAARAQQPFHMAQDHLSHLRSLYQSQSRSLQIAYSNLFHHLHPLIREFQTFAARAEQDLENEESLIRGARVDMALLPKVVVHEVFTRKKDRDKDKDVEGSDGKAKTLADYVHPRKMEQVRESCRITHGRSMPSSAKLEADVRGPEDHVTRFNDLARQMDELAGQSEAERKAAEERAATVDEEFSEGLARIAVALEQVEALLQSGAEGAAQGEPFGLSLTQTLTMTDLMELDQAMRDDLVALTGVKVSSCRAP